MAIRGPGFVFRQSSLERFAARLRAWILACSGFTRRRGLSALAVIALAPLLISSARQYGSSSGIRPDLERTLGSVLQHADKAVFAVGITRSDGSGFRPIGSAFSFTTGHESGLATAAHVACALEEHMKRGFRAVARNAAGRELEIVNTRIPTMFRHALRISEHQYREDAIGLTRVTEALPADVAVLIVAGELGDALPIAPSEALSRGREVAVAAFPSEGGYEATAVRTTFGHIASTPSDRTVETSAFVTGGSSGGALLVREGVCGIIVGGRMINDDETRIPIGLNYAVRSEALEKLLVGDFDGRSWYDQWRQQLSERYLPAIGVAERIARLYTCDAAEMVLEYAVPESDLPHVKTITLNEGFEYWVSAAATDFGDADIVVYKGWDVVGADLAEDSFPLVHLADPGLVHITTDLSGEAVAGERIDVRVFRCPSDGPR